MPGGEATMTRQLDGVLDCDTDGTVATSGVGVAAIEQPMRQVGVSIETYAVPNCDIVDNECCVQHTRNGVVLPEEDSVSKLRVDCDRIAGGDTSNTDWTGAPACGVPDFAIGIDVTCNGFTRIDDCGSRWLEILESDSERAATEGLVYTLCAIDYFGDKKEKQLVDVFNDCLHGNCACKYYIGGAPAQLRPCRVFAEAMCRGDNDPDWDYLLRGAIFGFKVIDSDCDSCYRADNYSSITNPDIAPRMGERLAKEIEEGLVSVVREPCTCIHALGSVPKGDDDFRAIVDCSKPVGVCVNEHTHECRVKFSYNSLEAVTTILREGDYMATVDISNAYRAVNIHPSCRIRQGLAWDFGEGIVYMQDNRLCMGLSSSPYVFSKISDFIVRCLVREGFSDCINYLDDFCIVARDEKSCALAQMRLVSILRRLGFYVSFKKLTSPSPITRFLGIEIDALSLELRLPLDKLDKLRLTLQKFIRKRKATKVELEVLGGILAHCCKVIHGGRTFSRRVYDIISSLKRPSHKAKLGEEFKLDLRWWIDFAKEFNGKAKIIPSLEPVISVYSDASLKGFGALHGRDWIAGFYANSGSEREASWLGHHWADADDPGCETDNINVLELWPVVLAVDRWAERWGNRTVMIITDNTQVRAAINTGRSKNKTSMKWLRRIFWKSIKFNFDLQSVYINTHVNVICDSLSRLDSFKNIARIRDSDIAGLMCCNEIFHC